jgi:hypothetical protein
MLPCSAYQNSVSWKLSKISCKMKTFNCYKEHIAFVDENNVGALKRTLKFIVRWALCQAFVELEGWYKYLPLVYLSSSEIYRRKLYQTHYDLFGLTYLNLSTRNALVKSFKKAYGNNLWHVHKLFAAYFHKLSGISYENNL